MKNDINTSIYSDPTNFNKLVGGNNQAWKQLLKKISQNHVERLDPHKDVGGMVENKYELIENSFNRLDCPITLTPGESTFEDISLHMMFRQRMTPERTKRLLGHAGFMANHIAPVDFFNPNFQNFIAHMDYREQIEGAGASALKFEWIVMQKFLKAYSIPFGEGNLWDYKPPSIPPPKQRVIPLPDQVHSLIQYKYDRDPYSNALAQYALMHSLMIGWRNPSETCLLKTGDIDFDKGTITITEKKKHFKQRIVVPDPVLMNSPRRKSFKNWVDAWRPKAVTQHSGDFLYLRATDGKPISEMQFTQFLTRRVKPIFPEFQMYCTRHWNAIATLIKSKLETDNYDMYEVRDTLGHENIQTSTNYIRNAKQYMKLAPYDWFKRVLRFNTIQYQLY